MVKLPEVAPGGRDRARPVALVDVFPTVPRSSGLAAPPGLAGPLARRARRAARTAAAARRIYSETLYPRLHLGWSDLASLDRRPNQYIESPRPELYDIVADPGREERPRRRACRRRSARCAPSSRGCRGRSSRPGSSDPEQVKKLAALGYISATTADLAKKDLPAPRDRIGAVEQLKAGFGAHAGRR